MIINDGAGIVTGTKDDVIRISDLLQEVVDGLNRFADDTDRRLKKLEEAVKVEKEAKKIYPPRHKR